MEFFFTVLGVVFLIEGIPYFAFPHKVKGWAEVLQTIPDNLLRYMGVGAMATGLLIIYIAKNYF